MRTRYHVKRIIEGGEMTGEFDDNTCPLEYQDIYGNIYNANRSAVCDVTFLTWYNVLNILFVTIYAYYLIVLGNYYAIKLIQQSMDVRGRRETASGMVI